MKTDTTKVLGIWSTISVILIINLELSSTSCEDPLARNLSVITVDCGGLIPIPSFMEQSSFLLKFESTFHNNEKCFWTLDNINNYQDYSLNVKVTLLCDWSVDTTKEAALSVVGLTWKHGDWCLPHAELKAYKDFYETNDVDYKLFLSFTSSSDPYFASGFTVQIDVLPTRTQRTGSNLVYTRRSGNENYGPFEHGNFFSMAISPLENNTTLTVNSLDSERAAEQYSLCDWRDALDIYEVPSNRSPKGLARERPYSYFTFACAWAIVLWSYFISNFLFIRIPTFSHV